MNTGRFRCTMSISASFPWPLPNLRPSRSGDTGPWLVIPGDRPPMDRLTRKFVWKLQKEIPVVLRRTGKRERLRVKLPYADDNRKWLRNGRRTDPAWFDANGDRPGYWEVPKAWFNDFVDRALERYGKVYIIQPYRAVEICSPACQNAVGHECQCSCMGEHHGTGSDGSWFEVS